MSQYDMSQYDGPYTSSAIPTGQANGSYDYQGALDNSYVTKKKEKESMFKEFKSYVLQHKDLLFGVVIALLLDSLVLDGALRGRLVAVLHKLLDRAEKLVDKNEISS